MVLVVGCGRVGFSLLECLLLRRTGAAFGFVAFLADFGQSQLGTADRGGQAGRGGFGLEECKEGCIPHGERPGRIACWWLPILERARGGPGSAGQVLQSAELIALHLVDVDEGLVCPELSRQLVDPGLGLLRRGVKPRTGRLHLGDRGGEALLDVRTLCLKVWAG